MANVENKRPSRAGEQDKNSVKLLLPNEFNKWLYIGKRGFEYCAETLERIWDLDAAIYDENTGNVFKDKKAMMAYEKELRFKDGPKAKKTKQTHV